MAYDITLEQRIDKLTSPWGLGKKKMFGGLGYFVNGNMCFAIRRDELLLRLDDEQAGTLLKITGVHIAQMGPKVMKNWLEAGGEAIATDAKLLDLLTIGHDYALNLPEK